jgi:hypothetical protein
MSISLRQAREPAPLSKLAADSSAKSLHLRVRDQRKELIEHPRNISAAECETRFQRREKRENASTIISTRSFRPVTSWSCTKSIAQGLVRAGGGPTILPQLCFDAALRCFVTQLQT